VCHKMFVRRWMDVESAATEATTTLPRLLRAREERGGVNSSVTFHLLDIKNPLLLP
jgi:hypothetical protein